MKKKFVVEDVQMLFDLMVHSMDFGSGFLDDDEVEALRRVAEQLGVEKDVATPSEFKHKYPHEFKPKSWDSTRCEKCDRAEDWKAHQPIEHEIYGLK